MMNTSEPRNLTVVACQTMRLPLMSLRSSLRGNLYLGTPAIDAPHLGVMTTLRQLELRMRQKLRLDAP
jgi:hypothetical protein